MPISDIITTAQNRTRQSLGLPDSTYIDWLNQINRSYSRKVNWPQLRVVNATLTTVANQAGYDLPSNFSRIMGEFVLWNPQVITGGYTGGTIVNFLNRGNPKEDSRALGYTAQGNGGQLIPQSVSINPKSGTPRTQQMVLAPFPSVANIIVLYNYYASPADFTSISDEIPVPTLYDSYVFALCKEIAMYLSDTDSFAMYSQMERSEYRAAMATLISQ